METVIKVKNIYKSYKLGENVLNNISLDITKGQVLVIMGPSGSGKSTLIRTFNGLERVDSGQINILGVEIDNSSNDREIQEVRNNVGMVFQQFNLFPHLSILENITIAPIEVKKQSDSKAKRIAIDLLNQMDISDQADKYPSQLSGGQQQRVAIARALALNPKIMLFDEPTSALDPEKVKEVLEAIKRLANLGMTMVVVTHEIKFASEVADIIVFMDEGRIVEMSSPLEFFNNAKEVRSRRFLSQMM